MKKYFLAGLFIFLLGMTHAEAAYEEYHLQADGDNSFQVFGRGLANLAASPLEISSSVIRETEMHSRLWPVTVIPRTVSNVIFRGTSAINDMLLLPWYAPFVEDTAPLTDGIGLPRYPWKVQP